MIFQFQILSRTCPLLIQSLNSIVTNPDLLNPFRLNRCQTRAILEEQPDCWKSFTIVYNLFVNDKLS